VIIAERMKNGYTGIIHLPKILPKVKFINSVVLSISLYVPISLLSLSVKLLHFLNNSYLSEDLN